MSIGIMMEIRRVLLVVLVLTDRYLRLRPLEGPLCASVIPLDGNPKVVQVAEGWNFVSDGPGAVRVDTWKFTFRYRARLIKTNKVAPLPQGRADACRQRITGHILYIMKRG